MTENDVMFQLLIALSRASNIDKQEDNARALIIHPLINWDKFIAICFKQKVAGLVFHNINILGLADHVPFRCYNVLRHFFYGNSERNKVIFDCLSNLVEYLHNENIEVYPLKGSILVPLIYKEIGCRIMNDIDLFVDKEKTKQLVSVMKKNGFIQGNYSRDSGTILPLSQEEYLIWKLKMFNLPPFRKLVKSKYIDVINVDFTFGLSYFDVKDVHKILLEQCENITGYRTLNRLDFFIHLCCHLYKEASNEAWIAIGQDINLIKFCDLREFLLTMLLTEDILTLQKRITELNVKNAVYFALYYTQLLYQEPQIVTFLNSIEVENTSFMGSIFQQGKQVVSKRTSSIHTLITTV